MDLTFPNLHPLNPDICVSAWPVFYEAELPDLSPIKGFFASIDNFTMWKTWQLGQSNVGQCMGWVGLVKVDRGFSHRTRNTRIEI